MKQPFKECVKYASFVYNVTIDFYNKVPIFKYNALKNNTMNTLQNNDNWDHQKDRLKQKFVFLKDTDLNIKDGKVEEMLDRLQIKLRISKEELTNIITKL